MFLVKRRGPESAKYEHQDRAENEARPGRHGHKVILPGSPQARRLSTAKISIGCSPAPVSRSDRRYTIQPPSLMSTSSTPFTFTNHSLHPLIPTHVVVPSHAAPSSMSTSSICRYRPLVGSRHHSSIFSIHHSLHSSSRRLTSRRLTAHLRT